MWLMVKMWDIAVVEYWKNGTTLYVAYGQNVGRLGYGIWESGTTLDVAYGQMWDDAVMEYGKWDNIRHGLWSKCGTMRLWNMGNGTTLDVSYGQNMGQGGYKIWKMGQH